MYMYQQSIKVTIFNTVNMPNTDYYFCYVNKVIILIIFTLTCPFLNQRKWHTNKWDELLFSFCCSEDKQTADSPCEEIRISGKIENEAKAFRSQNCKAFRSRKVSFRSQNISFRSQCGSFHSRSVPFRANRSAFPWCSNLSPEGVLRKLHLHHLK